MRLLKRHNDGELSFTKDLIGDDKVPTYAILSHTWQDGQEVTFDDWTQGRAKSKVGYDKIQFCAQQAERDGLCYFWVDTCCINKADHVELQDAINSMFRWYQDAAKCYVYLSDVSTTKQKACSGGSEYTWEPDFRDSRWFTRGWTLQELLAPRSVEFFSQKGERLGDKQSLEQQIQEITGIGIPALRGASLQGFSVDERLLWTKNRQTTRKEDKAYCLLGVFGIFMPLIYGEGEDHAFRRLRDEINKATNNLSQRQLSSPMQKEDYDCVKNLRLTDPRDDKKRIEDTKGGLLEDAYRWILDHIGFQQWRDGEHSRLLWIKGDPGKGKTMLLCGIIDELRKSMAETNLLSYFFCQATDSRINNATAVLRGLLYMLVSQQPSLVSYIRDKYDYAGKTLFEDANAWVALSEILINMLQDSSLGNIYLIIDALDECVTDLPKLLDFVAKQSSVSTRVKWIVSSRNWPDIEERLERAGHKVRLSLELNAESVSTAVRIFIDQKVSRLAQEKGYNDKTRVAVLDHLVSNANDTFLWVALVYQNLEKIPRWNVLNELNTFPPGLGSLYEQMMQQISKSYAADLCKQILALIALVYRPITLEELTTLVEQLEDIDLESIREIISLCGSFLTLENKTIYFVHQSAKDFLLARAAKEVFPSGREDVHYTIFTRSLGILSRTLQRDIYSLEVLGCPDLLATCRYSCVYWVDHLCDSNPTSSPIHVDDLQDRGVLDVFLREKYLYWLEALSLCKSMSKGVVSMTKLRLLVQGRGETTPFTKLVYDAHRFVMYHKGAIESSPLQAYASALLFSPTRSLVRSLFQHEEPEGITVKPAMGDSWSACLQTLEGHSSSVSSVAFSHNSTRLASSSYDKTIKIWDASSGACLHMLDGHSSHITSVVFSHDSTRLASTSEDSTVKIWDASSGACLQTLEGHSSYVTSLVFSHNSTRLSSASGDSTVKIWDASSGACLQTLKGHSSVVTSVAFSHDSTRLASASEDRTVKIWNASGGACLLTLEDHSSDVLSVVFSHDSTRLASASSDSTIKIWDASSGACLQTLEGHSGEVTSVAFSHDSTQLASASGDSTVKIWDASSGVCLQTPKSHSASINSMAFSHDSTWLASASKDSTVKIWDASCGACLQTLEGHSRNVTSVAFSYDSTQLASASWDSTVKIWDASNGACLQTLEGHSSFILFVVFSHDSTQLASASGDSTVKIWDASSGVCLQTLEGHSSEVTSVAFSHDSTRLASSSWDKTIKIWDASSGACLQTLEGHSRDVTSVTFLHDLTRLASSSWDETVKIWDACSGACLQILSIGTTVCNLSFDSAGSCLFTELGSIAISTLIVSSRVNIMEPQRPQYLSASVSLHGPWITYNGRNVLWLPSEYRGYCIARAGKKVGIGANSGRVWICSFDPHGSKEDDSMS